MARSRVYRAEAIVLRRTDFGEADRLLTLLTRDQGKVRAIAKGARRPASRHSGNLELFVHVQLLLARGRELDVVTQSQLVHPFRRVREDLDAASHAYYLAEVTDALLEPGDAAGGPFELLLEALEALEAGAAPTLLAAHFLLRLLGVLGYRPELFRCLWCGRELRPGANYLSLPQGGALCPRCGPTQPEARPIDVDALKLMRHLQRTDSPAALTLALRPGLAEQVDRQIRAFAEHQIERRFRTPEFITRLADPAAGAPPRPGARAETSLPKSAADGR